MEPHDDTEVWLESDPQVILDDIDEATLMVRAGMAMNALATQLENTRAADRLNGGIRAVRRVSGIVASAAITNEVIAKLITHHEARLSAWVVRAHSSGRKRPNSERDLRELQRGIDQLKSATHPASAILERARNKIGFHWDPGHIKAAVLAFARNKRLVWVEERKDATFHRLAFDVLSHILIPESDTSDEAASHTAIRGSLQNLRDAMALVLRFLRLATEGYAIAHGLELKRRERRR